MKRLALLAVFLALPLFAQDNTKLIVSGNFVSVNSAQDNNGFKATQELMVAPSATVRSDQFIMPGAIIALVGGEYTYPLSRLFKSNGYAINPQNSILRAYAEVGNGRSTLNNASKSRFAWAIGGVFDQSLNGVLNARLLDIAYVRSPFLTNGGQLLGHWELSTGLGIKVPWGN